MLVRKGERPKPQLTGTVTMVIHSGRNRLLHRRGSGWMVRSRARTVLVVVVCIGIGTDTGTGTVDRVPTESCLRCASTDKEGRNP